MLRWYSLVVLMLIAVSAGAAAPSGTVNGDWITPGKAVVRIAPCGADTCLTLIKLDPTIPATRDINNPDASLHQRPLCGLRIGFGFHAPAPSAASGGKLYDPQSGRTYSGKMVSEGDVLRLRGYYLIPLFGRTEIWHRSPHPVQPCG